MVIFVKLALVLICLTGQSLVHTLHFVRECDHLVDLLVAISDPISRSLHFLLQFLDLIQVSLLFCFEVLALPF